MMHSYFKGQRENVTLNAEMTMRNISLQPGCCLVPSGFIDLQHITYIHYRG